MTPPDPLREAIWQPPLPHEKGGRAHPSYEAECDCCGGRIRVTNNYSPMGDFLDQSIESVPAAAGIDVSELAAVLTERHIKDAGSCSESHMAEAQWIADRLLARLSAGSATGRSFLESTGTAAEVEDAIRAAKVQESIGATENETP